MAGGDSFAAVAGGPASHIPVLGPAAVGFLNIRDGGVYIDATFGAGGYTRAILDAADCRVIAIDRDPAAIALGAELADRYRGRLTLNQARFSDLELVAQRAGYPAVNGVVLDLGVSSMQFDRAERGFSFRFDGPLDMRMGREGPTASDIIAAATERELADIIFLLGEERHARAVARAIVSARAKGPIATTRALAEIVASAVRTRGGIHPATRTFQALRIFINEELDELAAALAAAERVLAPTGRLAVVSFHSLEDRMVKSFLSARSANRAGSRHVPAVDSRQPSFRVLTKRPVTPDADEIARNPRARSAKLRAAERTDAPACTGENMFLPGLPSLAQIVGRLR
ncbi:MAG TPA: 16S rRNA (cytosine(1402)-N(4))-methyltransferase RsmH [Pseudolabrys sp.]|nr:16S rRNA (cytosine(1402)-N(4))-methyltransferase RsmH [Pseudolabrys sp.]